VHKCLNHRLGNVVELGGGCNTSYLQAAALGSNPVES